jgi:hypothetical protein
MDDEDVDDLLSVISIYSNSSEDIDNLSIDSYNELSGESDEEPTLQSDERFGSINEYKNMIITAFAKGEIGLDQYKRELLEIEIHETVRVRRVKVDDEGLRLIAAIETRRKELNSSYSNGEITEMEHFNEYIKLLNEEKELIQVHKVTNIKGTKPSIQLSIDDLLESLQSKEEKLVKQIIKKNKLNVTDESYVIQRYVPGYVVKRIEPTSLTTSKVQEETPLFVNINDLKITEEPKELLNEVEIEEMKMSNRDTLRDLKNDLLRLQKSQLMDCYESLTATGAYSNSYITKLRTATIDINHDPMFIVASPYEFKRGYFYLQPKSDYALFVSTMDLVAAMETYSSLNIPTDHTYPSGAQKVYQIYTPFDGDIYTVTRYRTFDEYIRAKREQLTQSIMRLENEGHTGDTIVNLRMKVALLDETVDVSITEERDAGLHKLLSYVLEYCPSMERATEPLETVIFQTASTFIRDENTMNLNAPKYREYVKRTLFVFQQHPDILRDYANGILTAEEVVHYEVPLQTPPLDFSGMTPDQRLSTLLAWKPDTSIYDSRYNGDDPIMMRVYLQQENEKKIWETALMNLKATIPPRGYSPNLWRFQVLNKTRLKLPSQRIFRPATIADRIMQREQLERDLYQCDTTNAKRLSYQIEASVFAKARLPGDYSSTMQSVQSNLRRLCSFVNGVADLSEGALLALVEFMYKNGDETMLNETKVRRVASAMERGNIEVELAKLTEEELYLYQATLMATGETQRRFRLLRSIAFFLALYRKTVRRRLDEGSHVYVAPHVESTQPSSGSYLVIDNRYVVGGVYPNYRSLEGVRNYSRRQLEDLAGIHGLIIDEEDDFNYYLKVMSAINELTLVTQTKKLELKADNRQLFVRYADPPIATRYVVRPRIGVVEPGAVYKVMMDNSEYGTSRDYSDRLYAVPRSYTNYIPVYSASLRILAMEGSIVLEGPAIFEELDDEMGYLYTSPYYIEVEYRDDTGQTVYFREGVAEKNIKTRTIDDLCERFKTREACNNPTSMSLGGVRCQWTGVSCKESLQPTSLTDDEVWNYVPMNDDMREPWNNALNKARQYIKTTARERNLGERGVADLVTQQREALYNFRRELEGVSRQTVGPLYEKISVPLVVQPALQTTRSQPPEGMKLIAIRSNGTYIRKRRLTTQEVRDLDVYTLPGLGEVTIENVDDEIVTVKKEGKTYSFPHSRFVRSETTATLIKKPEFVYIKDEDYRYMMNPPSIFSWIRRRYDYTKEGIDDFMFVDEEVRYIDTTMIVPSGIVGNTRLITRDDVNDVMVAMAFSLFVERGDTLELLKRVNASREVIELALRENLSLLDLSKKSDDPIGPDDLLDVIVEKKVEPVAEEVVAEEVPLEVVPDRPVAKKNFRRSAVITGRR